MASIGLQCKKKRGKKMEKYKTSTEESTSGSIYFKLGFYR